MESKSGDITVDTAVENSWKLGESVLISLLDKYGEEVPVLLPRRLGRYYWKLRSTVMQEWFFKTDHEQKNTYTVPAVAPLAAQEET